MALVRNLIQRFKRDFKAKKVANAITAQAETGIAEIGAAVQKIAEAAAEDVRSRIKDQHFDHDPLSLEYQAWKRRAGKDPRTLISGGEYVASIEAKRIDPMLYSVGVKDTAHSSSIRMRKLSRVLERGTTDGIPARPHFGPVRVRARYYLKRMLNDLTLKQKGALKQRRFKR